jgi:SAM-dependent methyltransferase
VRPDAEELNRFYTSRTGGQVLESLLPSLAKAIRCDPQSRLLALGFGAPWLDALPPAAGLRVNACPALQGYLPWPQDGRGRTAQVDEKRLPFVDALFDQCLLVHVLEYADPARLLLRELWRVLAPGGDLFLIVPHRASLHMLMETTPFANGRPFGSGQLRRLLQDSMFAPEHLASALSLPGPLAGGLADRLLLRASPLHGGVHLLRARKQGEARSAAGARRRVQAVAPAGN